MKYIASLILMFSFAAGTSFAQTQPQDGKPAANAPNSKAPATKPITEKAPKRKVPKTAADLDAFFKEGEKQVKDGPRCDKPTPPIA